MDQIVGIAYRGEAGHDAGKVDHGVLEALMFGKTHGHPQEGRDDKPRSGGDLVAGRPTRR